MYIPKFNIEKDISILHSAIKSNPLSIWTCIADGEIVVNHIPFLLHEKRGEHGTLVGHVARANPIWKQCSTEKNSVVVFHGEQTYISPSWYPSKQEHGKVVPTWNYIVVHAHGIPNVIDDREWILQHVTELTNEHEANQTTPWKVSDAPHDFIEQMAGAIVGLEIPITTLNGKWKLGQNRSATEQRGIIAGATASNNPQAQTLARELQRVCPQDKGAR